MPDLDGMAQCDSVELLRQQLQEGLEILRVEFLGRHELPVDRPEFVPEFGQAAGQELLHGRPGLRQYAAIGAEARTLQREDEIVRRLLAPSGEALGLLRAVIGAVDLDRGQLARGIFELALLGQTVRIEGAPPGLEHPAADTDVDLACRRHCSPPAAWNVWPSLERPRSL